MTDRLQEIFNFTASDLNYNRRGQLSPEQLARVGQSRRRLKRNLWVLGLILLALAAGWTVIFARQPELSAAVVVIAVGVVIFALPGLGALYLGVRPAPPITIEKLQGRAKVARVERTSSSGGSTRRYVKTELHLGDRLFVVPDAAISALEDGAEYAVYAGQGAGDIFSLEQV